MHQKYFYLHLLSLAVLGSSQGYAQEQSNQGDQLESAVVESGQTEEATGTESSRVEPPAEIEHITVTGSRIKWAPPTARIEVIDAEEIKTLGVSNMEDLLRTVPQNLGLVNLYSNQIDSGFSLNPTNDLGSDINALGVSLANLGGVGTDATLVLIDGRRVAGAAGIEDGSVNLNTIPLNAVERVEIILDGASAVYGADAIGGVINIITKKDYTGFEVSVQQDIGDNGGDLSKISLFGGTNWDGGSFSINASFQEDDPVNARDAGWVTLDYRDQFADQPEVDPTRVNFVTCFNGSQPGALCLGSANPVMPNGGLTLRPDFDYSSGLPTQDDFVFVGDETWRDNPPQFIGQNTEQSSVRLDFQQDLFDGFRVFASGSYTETESVLPATEGVLERVPLLPGQAYMPFDQAYLDANVNDPFRRLSYAEFFYYPGVEYANGLALDTLENTNEFWDANIGFEWQIGDDHLLQFDYTKSESKSEGTQSGVNAWSSYVTYVRTPFDPLNPTAPQGILDCLPNTGNIETLSTDQAVRDSVTAQMETICQALTSSDPDVAFNPWRTSADDPGVGAEIFYSLFDIDATYAKTDQITLNLQGSLMEMPGGKLYYSVGAERFTTETDSDVIRDRTGITPKEETTAFFGELSVPIFGDGNRIPGFHQLSLSLQARYDKAETRGVVGTVDGTPVAFGGEPIEGTYEYSKTTPSFGVLWKPVPSLTVRANFSENFVPPNASEAFDATALADPDDPSNWRPTSIVNDPLWDLYDPNNPFNVYTGSAVTVANTELKPTEAEQFSIGADWQPEMIDTGMLTLSVNYRSTERKNDAANNSILSQVLPVEEYYALEEFFVRDPNQNNQIILQRNTTINLVRTTYESIEYGAFYSILTDKGSFSVDLTYLDNLTEEREITPGQVYDRIGYVGSLDDYTIVGDFRYSYGRFDASLRGTYLPSYINDFQEIVSGGVATSGYSQEVGSYTEFDLSMGYDYSDSLRIGMGIRNLFDDKPEFTLINQQPFDTGRWDPRGRTLTFNLDYSF